LNYILAGLIALMGFAHFMALRSIERERRAERQEWAEERSHLLNRLADPGRVIIPQEPREVVPHVVPEDEAELAMVGQIVWGDAD
jgi:hypothetical protein